MKKNIYLKSTFVDIKNSLGRFIAIILIILGRFFCIFSFVKKIYYIPGIFSIIFLPVLGIWYINSHGYFTKLSAHAFTYIDFEEANRSNEEIGADIFFSDKLVKRIYKEVHLNNDKNSKNIFKYIDQFVNDVVQKRIPLMD